MVEFLVFRAFEFLETTAVYQSAKKATPCAPPKLSRKVALVQAVVADYDAFETARSPGLTSPETTRRTPSSQGTEDRRFKIVKLTERSDENPHGSDIARRPW